MDRRWNVVVLPAAGQVASGTKPAPRRAETVRERAAGGFREDDTTGSAPLPRGARHRGGPGWRDDETTTSAPFPRRRPGDTRSLPLHPPSRPAARGARPPGPGAEPASADAGGPTTVARPADLHAAAPSRPNALRPADLHAADGAPSRPDAPRPAPGRAATRRSRLRDPAPGRPAGPRRAAVVYSSAEHGPAARTAEALRELGAEVVLVEGGPSALCATHPAELCGASCACGRRICSACRLAANGAARCAACAALARKAATRRRLRQLAALLVFALFVQQAVAWMARERALVDATGPVRVAIVQLVQPDATGAPLVAAMNGPGGLAAIGPWLEDERARYLGVRPAPFQVDVLGPWTAPVEPPAPPPRDPGWFDLLRTSLAYPHYFHDLARAHGVDPDAYGARVYVVYGRANHDLSGDSRGSRKGRVAVSFVPIDTTVAYAQLTVAHELAHVLGARDLYVEGTFLARFPEGYVEPWADPPYPQRYAELMAVDVPVTPSSEREARSLAEVRIGYRTAADLGWIPAEQADLYNLPALRGPEEALARSASGALGTR